MKKNVFIMMLLFILSIFSMELVAQENIHAVLKKCENNKNVDIDYTVEKKNPHAADNHPTEGKHETFRLVLHKDATALTKEFEAAFEKDKNKAVKISESKKGGKLYMATYQFSRVTYSFVFLSNMENLPKIDIPQTP